MKTSTRSMSRSLLFSRWQFQPPAYQQRVLIFQRRRQSAPSIEDFTLPDADGKEHSLNSLKGKNGTS